ncbi:SHOCT-like domain-containing protein [Deinococcus sp. PEB2-63]
MKEKIRRILDLIRAGKLTLDDAGPLLAALSPKLALTEGDREFVSALLGRSELDAGQVAEHIMLLRGVRDAGFGFAPPHPPQPPQPPRRPQVVIGGHRPRGLDGLVDRITGGIDSMVENITGQVERELHGHHPGMDHPGMHHPGMPPHMPPGPRILRIKVESQHGDEYNANIPVSLAPHLDRLIPPHGRSALESAGFTLDALRLLIEASPYPGPLIDAQDQHGNEVHISLL